MRYKIQSVWEEGQDCLDKYQEDLNGYHPVVQTWPEYGKGGVPTGIHSMLTIELDSLEDLERLAKRVGEIIVREDHSLEIYDDYRE